MFNSLKKYLAPFNYLDLAILIVILMVLFFTFQQADLMHTFISSIAYVKGHFLDFYEYNAALHSIYFTNFDYSVGLTNSYMSPTFILYSIWNIPMYLLGLLPDISEGGLSNYHLPYITIFYNKLLAVIIYFLSAIVLFKIGLTIKLDRNKSFLLVVIFITAPIAVFSQFIFGQYDIFTVFFMLLGLLYYYKKSRYIYIIFFGIAITFKYHALLFALPLILMREKNIFKLALYGLIIASPILVNIAIYVHSQVFVEQVIGFKTAKVFKLYTYAAFILLFIFSYFKRVETDDDIVRWSVFYLTAASFISFGLSLWHPQWLLMMIPFLALGTVINSHYKKLLIIDIFMVMFVIAQSAIQFPINVDQQLLNFGILHSILPDNLNTFLPMGGSIFPHIHKYFYFALFALCLLAHLILKYPKFTFKDLNYDISDSVNYIRVRFIVGVSLFVIPVFISFLSAKLY